MVTPANAFVRSFVRSSIDAMVVAGSVAPSSSSVGLPAQSSSETAGAPASTKTNHPNSSTSSKPVTGGRKGPMYKLDEGRSPFADLRIGTLPQLEAVKLETPRAARASGRTKRTAAGPEGAGVAARRGDDHGDATPGAANVGTRTTARVTAKQIVFPDLDSLAVHQHHQHRHRHRHQHRRRSAGRVDPPTAPSSRTVAAAKPTASTTTAGRRHGPRATRGQPTIPQPTIPQPTIPARRYRPSAAASEISRMHAPGSRRARELEARESLARAVADVGACPDAEAATALIAAIGAAEATARPGEGPSGFVAPALLARARAELAGAEARCEARSELHRAVEEGGDVSESAVRRALALGVAVDDPAIVSANATVLRRRRLAAAEEARRAEELRREIEGAAQESGVVVVDALDGDGPVRTRSPDGDDAGDGDADEEGRRRVLRDDLEVLRTVGEGAYGVVMRCRDRVSGEIVAVKEFKINSADPDVEEVRRTSTREVTVLRALSHPNIVAYLGDFYAGEKLYVAMEYLPRTLLEILDDTNGAGLPSEDVRLYVHQLCDAVAFMHAAGYVYRDIKPENLLVDDGKRLKLCDFGFARRIDVADARGNSRGKDPLTDYVATRWYRAPELLLGQPYAGADGATTRTGYGQPVDLWAVGCLMGELTDGEPLFPGDSDVDQLRLLQRCLGRLTPGQMMAFSLNPNNAGVTFNDLRDAEPEGLDARYAGKMSELELDFCGRLLTMNPKERITGEECLRHPYLAEHNRAED